MRGGPGLGNIQPSQGDYFQVTRSAGHGDYHPIVLAPASVQEAIDFTALAFGLADKYRHIVILAADGLIGQMMEPVELPPMHPLQCERPEWALTGAAGRPKRSITSFHLKAEDQERFNLAIQARLAAISAAEARAQATATDDAELLIVAYGTSGRVAQSALSEARERGLKVGLLRPQTLWPFPTRQLKKAARHASACLVVEMNAGQMLDDVRLTLGERLPIYFLGRMGGVVPLPEEVLEAIERYYPHPALASNHCLV
jgi:2-oxoglutarate ferredoxin oxidoreductase subunit alpha